MGSPSPPKHTFVPSILGPRPTKRRWLVVVGCPLAVALALAQGIYFEVRGW
ncbi:MAG: hypothetical protein ACHQ9S_02720 [Candidatus Binatia bacterium]